MLYERGCIIISKLFKPKVIATESQEQKALFKWAEYNTGTMPELDLIYHVPNEGKRSVSTAVRLKAEGLKHGVPDICLPVARSGYHGLYIEMKVGSNTPSDNQKQWLKNLHGQGHYTTVCYSWVEAAAVITNYLKGGD